MKAGDKLSLEVIREDQFYYYLGSPCPTIIMAKFYGMRKLKIGFHIIVEVTKIFVNDSDPDEIIGANVKFLEFDHDKNHKL